MNLCSNCVNDLELKSFIESLNMQQNCSFCNEQYFVCELETELKDFFQEIVDCYVEDANGQFLSQSLQTEWNLFKNLETSDLVFDAILPRLNTTLINSDCKVNLSPDLRENFGYWEVLKNKLKWESRYINDIEKLFNDLGWDGYFNASYNISMDNTFYRARIHSKSGDDCFSTDDMGPPDKRIVGNGRANPIGIPMLYLSEDIDTVLYEVRAAFLDEISVGSFKLENEEISLKIVDFTEIPSIYNPGNVRNVVLSKRLREILSVDLSKPIRRYDSELEYIPTQFICEFVKLLGADGIRFKSSLYRNGKNIVLFDYKSMSCINVIKVQVSNVEIIHRQIN